MKSVSSSGRSALLLLVVLFAGLATGLPARAQDLVDFTVEYSLDGENFDPTLSALPGQEVIVRITIESRTGTIMDIMGEDDLDFDTWDETIQFFVLRDENGPCFVIVDAEMEILKVRCPFCEINDGEPVTIEFTARIRDEAPPGTSPPMVLSLLQLEEGEEGEPRPCTTLAPEPIGVIQEEEVPPSEGGVIILLPLLGVTSEASTDGVNYSPSVIVQSGEDVFFRTVLTNEGTAPFFTATFEDTLPEGFADVQIQSPMRGLPCTVVDGRTVSCSDLGEILPGESVEILYKATVTGDNEVLVTSSLATATPGTEANPGTPVSVSGGVTVFVGLEGIPTLTGWGIALLALLLAAGVILHRRMR
jgi:uncharacterized repeat protein (TIGR01451 family)